MKVWLTREKLPPFSEFVLGGYRHIEADFARETVWDWKMVTRTNEAVWDNSEGNRVSPPDAWVSYDDLHQIFEDAAMPRETRRLMAAQAIFNQALEAIDALEVEMLIPIWLAPVEQASTVVASREFYASPKLKP